MRETVVSAAATGLPNSENECPVAPLAREVTALNATFNRLDILSLQSIGPLAQENDVKMAALVGRRSGIEEQASSLAARSGLGAIFQLGLILMYADSITSWVPEGSKAEQRCLEMKKSIDRMCHGLASYVESATGTNAKDAGGDYYFLRRNNPYLRETFLASEHLTKSANPACVFEDAASEEEPVGTVDSVFRIGEGLSPRALIDAIQSSENFIDRAGAAKFCISDEEGDALNMLCRAAQHHLAKMPAQRPADVAVKISYALSLRHKHDLGTSPLVLNLLCSAIADCEALEVHSLKSAGDALVEDGARAAVSSGDQVPSGSAA